MVTENKKIAIIGAGQLGSRHLQGACKSSIKVDIEVVDPSESAIEIARERFYEVDNRTNVINIKFFESIEQLSDTLDLVIVATTSDVRFQVINELLFTKSVKNLVLEKVLFQSIDDYYKVETLLRNSCTRCWVNHPRRMFPVYIKLKRIFSDSTQICLNYQAGNWGLGCNALHFIDLLSYFANSREVQISAEYLDRKFVNSKRPGFIEFTGLLCGKVSNHIFSLYAHQDYIPPILTIVSDKAIARIDELKDKYDLNLKENNWQTETIKEKIVYYQSELTNQIIYDILVKGETPLPLYEDSMNLHVPFIKGLLEHMDRIESWTHVVCPIT